MCSRYSLTSPHEAVRTYFGYANAHTFPPRYNIAPTQPVAIVRLSEVRAREIALVRWGLIPAWSKDPSKFRKLFNARAETVAEKPSFRGPIRHRRCLVPADAFYEWTATGAKRPYMIRRKDKGLLALAGIWEGWLGADGSEIDTMAILTVPSNLALSWLHDRMPAILEPPHFEGWLDGRAWNAEEAVQQLAPAADDVLEMIEIGTAINSPRNEGATLQTPERTLLL